MKKASDRPAAKEEGRVLCHTGGGEGGSVAKCSPHGLSKASRFPYISLVVLRPTSPYKIAPAVGRDRPTMQGVVIWAAVFLFSNALCVDCMS